jgi:hypothetical protein
LFCVDSNYFTFTKKLLTFNVVVKILRLCRLRYDGVQFGRQLSSFQSTVAFKARCLKNDFIGTLFLFLSGLLAVNLYMILPVIQAGSHFVTSKQTAATHYGTNNRCTYRKNATFCCVGRRLAEPSRNSCCSGRIGHEQRPQ